MFKPTMILLGLAAVAAGGRPAEDREAPPSEAAPRQLEMARAERPQATSEPAVPTRRAVPAKRPEKRAAPPAPEIADPEPNREPEAARQPEPARAPEPVHDSAPVNEPAATPDTSGYTAYPEADTAPVTTEVPESAPAADASSVLGVGTVIRAALEDSIHSRHDVSGKEVNGRVMDNVTGPDGEVLVPAGAPVRLTVTQVKPGRGGRDGVLELRTDYITLGGQPRKLEAGIRSVPHELRGRGVTGEEAAKVGVGAAGGAVVGRVITGDAEGAVIGGVVGAAGGAVVASKTARKDVVVKARTPVELVLTAPLVTR